MLFKQISYFVIFTCTSFAFAQEQATIVLDELIISDYKLNSHNKTQTIHKINDSIIQQANGNLTDLLLMNSSIYFKENGSGMVSSPSFRGTTAQQTSVLWNGIGVNSLFLGQTDFNSISYKEFSEIAIKPGGGSVLYGSGAIGGTIHLNNPIRFEKRLDNTLQLGYGSFNTFRVNNNFTLSNEKWFTQININRNQSDNDFEVKNRTWKNTNGQFYNNSASATIGYKIDLKNTLSFYSTYFNDERHFSLVSENQTKTKYQNSYFRNILHWKNEGDSYKSNARIAYFNEGYKYFNNLPTDDYSSGNVNSFIAKYDFEYFVSHNFSLNAIIDYTNHHGTGKNSGIKSAKQEVLGLSILANHRINEKMGYEIGFKQEINNSYENPFLYSAGFYYKPANVYQLKINGSKNFRIPTFNDIFWEPGGNKSLQPETSFQFDLRNEFKFENLRFGLNTYYTKIDNMLQWIPNNTGIWEAQNLKSVTIKGAEFDLQYQFALNKNQFKIQGTYAYTNSQDTELKKQLIYTPFHKITGQISYNYEKFSAGIQTIYNGAVFTTASNLNSSKIEAYALINANVQYHFGKKIKQSLIFEIKNITDVNYENVINRPMPGRNFNIQLITKF